MPLQICRVLCHVTWDLGIPTLVSGMWYVYHSDNLVQNRLIYAANEVNFFLNFLNVCTTTKHQSTCLFGPMLKGNY